MKGVGQGVGGGRPLTFKTPEALQEKIDAYFESCWTDRITQTTAPDGTITESNVRYQDRPYTVAGLAVFLGFASRQSLCDYNAKPKFLDIIKKAKLKIEMNVEEKLLDGKNATGAIFWLKNHADYRDKTEVDHGIGESAADVIGEIVKGIAVYDQD